MGQMPTREAGPGRTRPSGRGTGRGRVIATAALLGLPMLGLLLGRAGAQEIRTELITLRTSDGVELAAAVYTPPVAPRAAVVSVHGYAGSFYSGVQAHFPRALARSGYLVVVPNMRDHDRGPKTARFEESALDIAAAVDEAASRGPGPVILHGQSMGTNRVCYYLAERADPRVVALVLTAGPGDLFEWNVRVFGREAAQRTLAEAQRRIAEGRGRELMLVDLGPLGQALYSADHLVSLRGPDTRSNPYRNLAAVRVPVLIVQGTADPLVDREHVPERLRASARAAPRVDVLMIDGADHAFSRHRAELADAVIGWLGKVLGAATER